jgi:hypothetical protein
MLLRTQRIRNVIHGAERGQPAGVRRRPREEYGRWRAAAVQAGDSERRGPEGRCCWPDRLAAGGPFQEPWLGVRPGRLLAPRASLQPSRFARLDELDSRGRKTNPVPTADWRRAEARERAEAGAGKHRKRLIENGSHRSRDARVQIQAAAPIMGQACLVSANPSLIAALRQGCGLCHESCLESAHCET